MQPTLSFIIFYRCVDHLDHHSFPTRRSSDLGAPADNGIEEAIATRWCELIVRPAQARQDRKSTRLNSSHANISYAVFCVKKKRYDSTDVLPLFNYQLMCTDSSIA